MQLNGATRKKPQNHKVSPPKGQKAVEGVAGFHRQVYYDSPDRLDTQIGYEVERYSIPSRNPIVKSALDTVSNATFWPESSIKTQNDYDTNPEYEKLDKQILSVLEYQTENLGYGPNNPPQNQQRNTFSGLLKTMLTDARIYGFSIAEMVWEKDGLQNRLQNIKIKPSWNFNLVRDGYDNLRHVEYIENSDSLSPDRFLIGTWPKLKWGNFHGRSDLQSILHDIEILEKLEAASVLGAESSSFKNRLLWLDGTLTADQYDAVRNAFRQASGGGQIEMPMVEDSDGRPIKAVQSEIEEDRSSPDTLKHVQFMIQEYIKRISRSLGVPDDLGNVSVSVGSWAKAKESFNMFVSTVEAAQEWVEQLANKILKTIVYYNFNTLPKNYKIPRWSFDAIEEDYENARADFLLKLIDGGIITADESWVRKMFDLPIDDRNSNDQGNELPEIRAELEEQINQAAKNKYKPSGFFNKLRGLIWD